MADYHQTLKDREDESRGARDARPQTTRDRADEREGMEHHKPFKLQTEHDRQDERRGMERRMKNLRDARDFLDAEAREDHPLDEEISRFFQSLPEKAQIEIADRIDQISHLQDRAARVLRGLEIAAEDKEDDEAEKSRLKNRLMSAQSALIERDSVLHRGDRRVSKMEAAEERIRHLDPYKKQTLRDREDESRGARGWENREPRY